MACVASEKDYGDEYHMEGLFDMDYPRSEDGDIVDYYGYPQDLRDQGMKIPDRLTYVISSVNSRNKFSRGFKNCTSLIVAGIDKQTGENISILTHQDPEKFLEKYREGFDKDLSESLANLQNRSVPGTVDAVITGGNYRSSDEESMRHYTESIQTLSQQVKNRFGFSPLVIAGPKIVQGGDTIFYQTPTRRLYLIRPEETKGKRSNSPYDPKDLHSEVRNWEE